MTTFFLIWKTFSLKVHFFLAAIPQFNYAPIIEAACDCGC